MSEQNQIQSEEEKEIDFTSAELNALLNIILTEGILYMTAFELAKLTIEDIRKLKIRINNEGEIIFDDYVNEKLKQILRNSFAAQDYIFNTDSYQKALKEKKSTRESKRSIPSIEASMQEGITQKFPLPPEMPSAVEGNNQSITRDSKLKIPKTKANSDVEIKKQPKRKADEKIILKREVMIREPYGAYSGQGQPQMQSRQPSDQRQGQPQSRQQEGQQGGQSQAQQYNEQGQQGQQDGQQQQQSTQEESQQTSSRRGSGVAEVGAKAKKGTAGMSFGAKAMGASLAGGGFITLVTYLT